MAEWSEKRQRKTERSHVGACCRRNIKICERRKELRLFERKSAVFQRDHSSWREQKEMRRYLANPPGFFNFLCSDGSWGIYYVSFYSSTVSITVNKIETKRWRSYMLKREEEKLYRKRHDRGDTLARNPVVDARCFPFDAPLWPYFAMFSVWMSFARSDVADVVLMLDEAYATTTPSLT